MCRVHSELLGKNTGEFCMRQLGLNEMCLMFLLFPLVALLCTISVIVILPLFLRLFALFAFLIGSGILCSDSFGLVAG